MPPDAVLPRASSPRPAGMALGVVLRLGGVLALGGCTVGPTVDVLGSFFPAWLLCVVLGVAAALLARVLLGAAGLGGSLLSPPLTYLGIAVAATLGFWLLWLGR